MQAFFEEINAFFGKKTGAWDVLSVKRTPGEEKTLKRITILLALLICFTASVAQAEGRGLSGPLLQYVSANRDYDGYSASTVYYNQECPTSAAVMHSKDHNILLVYGTDANGNHSVWRSTTAILQPDVTNETPSVICTADTVSLKTDSFGRYTFTWDGNENAFILTRAEYGSFSLSLRDGVYYSQNGLIWQAQPIQLQNFNVSLFPITEYDMLRMNRVYAALGDASGFWYENVIGSPGKTIPVYTAPDQSSFRAAGGKAAVNTTENFWLLASVKDWDLVEYDVSLRTHRVGWVNGASLSKYAPVMMTDVPAVSVQYLTDDPFCSQNQTFSMSRLRDIHLLALADPFYAYASAKTADGQPVWGFVPVQSCALPDEVIDESVMSQFCGTWVFASGGEVAAEVMALHPDGSCELGSLKNEATIELLDVTNGLRAEDAEFSSSGTWYVIDSLSPGNYEKNLIVKNNGMVTSLGLYALPTENEDGYMAVTLCRGETGGGYVKATEEEQPLHISAIELTYTDPETNIKSSGFGYDRLEDRWKPFFQEETWGKARFLIDPEWEEEASYSTEHHYGIYRHYPIVTVLDGCVQVHLFNVEGNDISEIARTSPDCGMIESNGCKVSSPIYHLIDAVGELDGIYRYRETLDLYFNSALDPWNIQIVLETEQADDPDSLHVVTVLYQFNEPRKTAIRGLKYDNVYVTPSEEGLVYGYSYWEEPVFDSLLLPLTGSTSMTEFRLESFPASPEELLTEATVDTRKHGSGGAVNLRGEPNKKGQIIMQIPNGTSVQMAELGNGWCTVKYGDQFGYMMAEYLRGTTEWEK